MLTRTGMTAVYTNASRASLLSVLLSSAATFSAVGPSACSIIALAASAVTAMDNRSGFKVSSVSYNHQMVSGAAAGAL